MDLFHAIEQSGHLHPYFDYAHGYGVPQAKVAIADISKDTPITFEVTENNGKLIVRLNQSFFEPHFGPLATSSIASGRRPRDNGFRSTNTTPLNTIPPFFHWHLEGSDGMLTNYFVVQPRTIENPILEIETADWKGKKFRCFYKGYLFEKQF